MRSQSKISNQENTNQQDINKLSTINIKKLENTLNTVILEYNLDSSTILLHEQSSSNTEEDNNELILPSINNINCVQYYSFPICYQQTKVASLNIPKPNFKKTISDESIKSLRVKLALIINRYSTNKAATTCLGKSQSLIGFSNYIFKIERFIERASLLDCGVVIDGECGSEKLSVATAIHYNSNRRKNHFIELNCSAVDNSDFPEKLTRCINRSAGGTLFLSQIHCLSQENQNILVESLSASSFNSQQQLSSREFGPRLLVSCNNDISANEGSLCFRDYLITNFNFLEINVPPLRNRREDIPFILDGLLDEYKVCSNQSFSNKAKIALQSYQWPGNYAELERAITKIIVHSSQDIITVDEIQEICPEVLTKNTNSTTKSLVSNLKSKNFSEFNHLHLAVQKSLVYIANNSHKNISLNTLASNACVSPSHLSHLFKLQINISFKKILINLRIDHAKDILKSRPLEKITNISHEVGFGDLSYFEKSFKERESMTPRQYKERNKQ